jgi:actin-related protein
MLSAIWKQEFTKIGGKKLDESESCLCLTVPPIIPDIMQSRIAEVVFEDFQFDALS